MSRHTASLVIIFSVLGSVCRVFLANRHGNKKWLPLPPAAQGIETPLTVDALAARVDRIVRFIIVNTAHSCLYFSYARCRVLRRYGYRVKMNIGLHNLYEEPDTEGHCWITLNDRAMFEETNPNDMYPHKIGERDDTVYWMRFKDTSGKRMMRMRNE